MDIVQFVNDLMKTYVYYCINDGCENTYKLFEDRYKKSRGIFGKISDYIVGREDMSSIILKNNYSSSTYYKFKDGKILKIDRFAGEYGVKTKEFIKFKQDNPESFILVHLYRYSSRLNIGRYKLIKLELLLNDLISVVSGRFDILWVDVDKNYENDRDIKIKVALKEIGFEPGDGMPNDIYDDYVSGIKNGMKKKKDEYIKKYNILQLQKTTQKMKYRSIELYSVISGYKSKTDQDNGIIKIEISPCL